MLRGQASLQDLLGRPLAGRYRRPSKHRKATKPVASEQPANDTGTTRPDAPPAAGQRGAHAAGTCTKHDGLTSPFAAPATQAAPPVPEPPVSKAPLRRSPRKAHASGSPHAPGQCAETKCPLCGRTLSHNDHSEINRHIGGLPSPPVSHASSPCDIGCHSKTIHLCMPRRQLPGQDGGRARQVPEHPALRALRPRRLARPRRTPCTRSSPPAACEPAARASRAHAAQGQRPREQQRLPKSPSRPARQRSAAAAEARRRAGRLRGSCPPGAQEGRQQRRVDLRLPERERRHVGAHQGLPAQLQPGRWRQGPSSAAAQRPGAAQGSGAAQPVSGRPQRP